MSRHIDAKQGDIAKFVLLPGDPQRAEYIAKTFLTDVKRYSDYRLMYGFTGLYKGKPISIQTTGMGSPSISIIVEELQTYGVKTLVRLGTAGTIQDDIGLYDMSGNVAEWCSDWYNSFYYKECPYNDPSGATFGKGRVVRGGDWESLSLYARVFCRMSHDPKYKAGTIGMRLAQ